MDKMLRAMRVSEELHSEIVRTAEEDERTMQLQIRWLLKKGLEFRSQNNNDEEQRRNDECNRRVKKDYPGKSSDNAQRSKRKKS